MKEINHLTVGKFGESQCVKYIKKVKKLKVLDRNVVIGKLEADIIAYDKNHIIFIEVKTRRTDKNNFCRPAMAVNYDKRTNLLNFAYIYCKQLPQKHKNKSPRIDVCEMYVMVENKLKVCEINYIENAVTR